MAKLCVEINTQFIFVCDACYLSCLDESSAKPDWWQVTQNNLVISSSVNLGDFLKHCYSGQCPSYCIIEQMNKKY